MYICVSRIDFAAVYTIYPLDFKIILTVWYFLSFMLLVKYQKDKK
jgi:hypothetical protein